MPNAQQDQFCVDVLDAPRSAFPQATPVDDPPAQGSDADGSSLVNDPAFERLIEAMEADGEAADQTWKSQSSDDVFDWLQPNPLTQYNADGAACDKARQDFILAWNKLVLKQGTPAALLAAYDIYSLRIGALQFSNARIGEFIGIKAATIVKAYCLFIAGLAKAVLARRLEARLLQLAAELQKAAGEVTNAKWKLGLNAAASAITMVLAPEKTVWKVALGVGAVSVHILIDRGLGEGGVTGTVVFVGGESQEAVEGASEAFKKAVEEYGVVGRKSFGIAGAALTAILDTKDFVEARDKLEEVQRDVEATRRALEDLLAGLTPQVDAFIAQDRALKVLNASIAQAMVRANDAAINYEAIKQEIQKAMQAQS
jgi:hypothetical protein